MYCSFRIYIDKAPNPICPQNISDIFSLFENAFGKRFDFISMLLFDPESDGLLVDKKFSCDDIGKSEFLNTDISPVMVGKSGEMSAPFIRAACNGSPAQLYTDAQVEIQFPVYAMPFTVRADGKQGKDFSFQTYTRLIQTLNASGFSVNNAFCHRYSRKNEAVTLDGGQLGSFVGCRGRRNLKNSVQHRKKGCLNRLMGIYCANSIRADLLSEETQKQITALVGSDCTQNAGNVFSFTLGTDEALTPLKRIRRRRVQKKLEALLCRIGGGN